MVAHPFSLAGYTACQPGILFRNPKPHVRSVQAYFPTVVAIDRDHLGATVVLAEAFEAANMHVVYFESTDGGKTWSRKSTVTEATADSSSSTVGRIGLLPDGTLHVMVTRHERHFDDEGLTHGSSIAMRRARVEVYRSTDRGATWSGPELPTMPITGCAFELCSGITSLEDGTVLWPAATWPTSVEEVHPSSFRTGAFVSKDDGHTWSRWMEAYPNDRNIYWEAKITQLQDLRLLGVAWVHDLDAGCDLPNHYVIGNADGSGWSAPQSTGIRGQTLSSVVLDDGKILNVYRRVDQPGLWASVSTIEGDQWVNQEDQLLWGGHKASGDSEGIREHFATLRFGAPWILKLPGGTIFIAFWAVVEGVSQINTITLLKK